MSADPSGRKAAPPWLAWVLKLAPATNTKGAFVVFCWASTRRVWVSKRVGPERNVEPSGATASTGETTGKLRLRNTVAEGASYTKTVRAAACSCTPTMVLPSGVACKWAFTERKGTPFGAGTVGVAGAAGATVTNCR